MSQAHRRPGCTLVPDVPPRSRRKSSPLGGPSPVQKQLFGMHAVCAASVPRLQYEVVRGPVEVVWGRFVAALGPKGPPNRPQIGPKAHPSVPAPNRPQSDAKLGSKSAPKPAQNRPKIGPKAQPTAGGLPPGHGSDTRSAPGATRVGAVAGTRVHRSPRLSGGKASGRHKSFLC